MQGAKTLFGGTSQGEKKLRKARPTGFTSAGLSGSYNKKTRSYDITRSSELTESLKNAQDRLMGRSAEFGALRGRVAGDFGEIVKARVKAIRDAGSRTVGSLRQELGKRRVAGSSFAQREIGATEAMFGREEERARAEGKIQELGFEASLIDEEFGSAVQAALLGLEQLNLESGIAANMGKFASQQMFERARLRSELDATIEGTQIEWMAMERQMAHDFWMGMMGGGGGGMGGGSMPGASMGSMMGGGGGSGMGGAAMFMSDRRLKRNVRRIGTVAGYPWYSFEYVWGAQGQGVMSDEVPDRYVHQIAGFDAVDYGGLLNAV